MIDFGPVDGSFIGAAFVRHDDILFVGKIGDEVSREGEHGAEGSMAVQETFTVQAEKLRIDGAFCVNRGVAASFDAGEIGLFGVEREASVGAEVAEEFEADARIFAAADGDEIAGGVDFGDDGFSRFMFDSEMNQVSFGSFDIINIEKFAEAVKVEFLEKVKLFGS